MNKKGVAPVVAGTALTGTVIALLIPVILGIFQVGLGISAIVFFNNLLDEPFKLFLIVFAAVFGLILFKKIF